MHVLHETDGTDVGGGGLTRVDEPAHAVHPLATATALDPRLGEHLVVLLPHEQVLALHLVHARHLLRVALLAVPPLLPADDVVRRVAQDALVAVAVAHVHWRAVLEALLATQATRVPVAGGAGVRALRRTVLLHAGADLLQLRVQQLQQRGRAHRDEVRRRVELLRVLEHQSDVRHQVARGRVLAARQPVADRPQVHRLLHDAVVRGEVLPLRIHGRVEDAVVVLVLHQHLQQRAVERAHVPRLQEPDVRLQLALRQRRQQRVVLVAATHIVLHAHVHEVPLRRRNAHAMDHLRLVRRLLLDPLLDTRALPALRLLLDTHPLPSDGRRQKRHDALRHSTTGNGALAEIALTRNRVFHQLHELLVRREPRSPISFPVLTAY